MRLDELERELRAERPEPDTDFARQLDDWARDGFPRDRGLGPRLDSSAARGGTLARLRRWLAVATPRRALLPVGAMAMLIVVIAVAVDNADQIGDRMGGSSGSDDAASAGGVSPPGDAARQADGGEGAPDAGPATGREAGATGEAAGAVAAPDQNLDPRSSDGSSSADELDVSPSGGGRAGGIARGAEKRIVDASARMTLGAEAGEVQGVANEVVEVTDRHHGIVSDSQVTSDRGEAHAALSLQIPHKRLDAALGDLSGLADVISRSEATEDITARAVRARRELARTFDRLRRARTELIRADTRQRRLVLEARIDSLEATADAQRSRLDGVKRQGRFATVDVEVTSGAVDSGAGGWSLRDALDDAGRVLEVIGGVALITVAVLAPLALIAALAWLIATRAARALRERALD